MAEELAAGPTNAIAETKKLLIDSDTLSLTEELARERKKIRIVEIVEMLSKESKLLLKRENPSSNNGGLGGFEPRIWVRSPAGFQATSRAQIPLFCRR